MIAVVSLVAAVAVVLLVIEDCCRRTNRARVRYLEGWIHRHFTGADRGDYSAERAYDTRRLHP